MGELDRLLVSAGARNALRGVTGALLYDNVRFFQYFDGSLASVQETYARVKASTRHTVVAEIYNGPITERHFPDWQMGCRKVHAGSIVEISAKRWDRTRIALAAAGKKPEAIQHLLAFWDTPHQV